MNEYEIALAQIEAQQPTTLLEPLQTTQAQPTVIDGDTLLTQYGSTRIAGIDAPESYSSNKSKIIADKYGVSEEQQTLLGSKAKQKLEDLKGTHLLTNSGVDVYGRILGENPELANIMVEEGLAVPYTRYDNKLQDTYRKSAEKRKELFGDDSQLKALEAQREYNLNREAPSTMKMLGQSVDAFQSGLAKTVLDTADAVMDLGKFWGDGNSAFLDEAKKQENIDKWTGYDRREAEFRLNETLHQFKQGEYVDGIINMIPVAPQLAAESLPMMLGMVFGAGKFTVLGKAMSGAKTAVEADKIQKAAKLGERLSYKLADNAGFAAVYSGQLNDRLDERKENQGGAELSAGEVIGVAAEEFLTLGLDRFAFDKVIGVSQGRKALKDIAKLVPDEGKMAVAKKLAETSGRIIAAVGIEAGQEFIQEFGNSLGAELGTKKFGSDIITDERVKQAQIAAIAGGAAGGHMRSNVEAVSAVKDFVQDTAVGKTVTDTIDNVHKASEAKRQTEKADDLIKDRKKVVDESANAILGSATSSKVGVKNEDGSINIEATIDDAVQRVNAVLGTNTNAYIESSVATDIMNKALANAKDETSLAKLTEVATAIKEKYATSFNMEEYLENRVNDALTMELDEISYRSENETNDELSRNLFKDVEGEKPADLFKASVEDTQKKIDAVKNVLFSFPIDDDKKTKMLEKFTKGLELIQKYKEQGGKTAQDVQNELRNTGFIRMAGKGEVSGKSLKEHETDIVNGITKGTEPSSAIRALKTLVDGRYKKGFGTNKVNKLTGEKEINHSQSYVQSILDDNSAIISMLTKIRTLTDASKYDKEYGSQIDAMIERLNQSNEITIDSGISFKKAIDKMKKLGLYEPTKTKQVEKPEVAPQGATIKQDSKPAENGKVSTPTPTVKLNVNDKNKIESVVDKNGKVHEIMNNTLTSVVGTMFRSGMMDILPYRNMKVTINEKTETRRIYRFGNVMYRISQKGTGKAKAINATRVVPANIEMTQEDIAWLKSFESNSMFTQNHVAKQTKTEPKREVKPTENKVETKPTQPEIDYEAILDTIENTAVEEEVVQEYINPEVLVLEKEATELSAELKKIKTALKKFEGIAESSITERTRAIMNGAEVRMQEIRARLYEIENELKIKDGESTLGMRLWSKMSKLTQQVLKPINKSKEAMGIFDNILMPITNPKADFRTIIESMPIGKRILAGNEEYRAKILEKLVASRTKLAPLMSIMKTHLTPEKIGSEGKYTDRNMPELKIVNGEVVNAGNPKDKINLLKLILVGNDLSQNQKEIITYGALKALSEMRSISRKADEQMVASMFGIRTDDENIYNILGIVQQGKIPKVVIQAKIGKFILDMMGFKVSRDLDMNLKSKLELSLGMLAIDVIRNTTFEDDKGVVIPLITEASEFISDEVGDRDLIKINETIVDDSFVDAVDAFAYLTNSEDRTHPSVEPIKETSRRKRGTGSPLSDEEVQYKLDQQQQGWKFNKTMDFINRINDNLLKQVLGWKNIKNARDKGLMHAEEVRVQKSINNQVERSIGYAKQYFTLFGKEQSMYMPWDMHASDRYMMEGNFNPDEDKLHRFVANKEDMIGEIDLANEKDLVLFELAIAQALDYGLDKKSDMTALKNLRADIEITKNGVEFKDTKKGNLYKAVYDIVSSNEAITAKEAKAIKQLVESGEGAHAIQAMVEVVAIDKAIKAKESKYISEMTIEADAITSGMALTLLQIGSDKAMQLLAKTGIYTDTMFKAYQALLQYTDMKGQSVTHGILREAKFVKPVAQKDKQYLATVGIEIANTGDRLLYDFYEHIGEMANREIQKMDTKDNVLVNFVTQVTEKSKDKIIDRAMAKSPVMTTIYGSLINTIKRNLGFEIGKKNIIKAIQDNEKLRNMTFSDFLNAKFEAGSMEWNLKALILFLTEGNKYPPMFETIDDAGDIIQSKNQILGNMVFSNRMNKNVSKIAQDTFGQAFEEAFKDIQEVNQYRNTIKTLSEASFQLFRSRLNRELKKLKTEVVTRNQFEEVLRNMEGEGYGYYVKNIYGSMQYLYNNEKKYISDSKVMTKKLDVATGQNAIGYNEDSPISNNKAAPVITIHSIDGFINSRIKEKVLNIKDANLMGMKSSIVNNVRGVYNKSTIESAREHSVLSNMIEHLNFMVSKATKSEKDAIKLTKDELNDFAKGAGLEVQNLKNIALAVDKAYKVIKSKRQKNLSGKIHSNHMYISDENAVTEVSRGKTKQIKGLSVSSLKFISQIFSGDVGKVEFKETPPVIKDSKKDSSNQTVYINHSGGAIGSDYTWGKIGEKYGIKSNHYFKDKTPHGNTKITEEQFKEGIEYAKQAAKHLGRAWSNKPYIQGLLSRNWQQVKNADAIFAIGTINGRHVEGGTGYAVEMAKMKGIPINVFDQSRNAWYKFTENKWIKIETPTLTKDFAGIGTREINENGIKAIADVYENTFNKKSVKPMVEPKRSVGEATKKSVQKPKQEPSKVKQEPSDKLSNEGKAYLLEQMRNSYGSTDESIGQNDTKLGSEEKYSLVENITSVLDEMLSREYPDQEDAYAKNLKSTMQSIKEIFEVAGLDKEVTIQKWKTDSVTRGSVDIMANKIDLAISNTNMMFTESEVLMHELLHIVTEHAIQLNPSLRADIRAVQEAVEKALGKNGYEIFIAHMEQPTSEDVAMAKKAYNYAILGNESEFMAYAMTNQNLFESIQNLRVNKPLFSKMSGDSTFAKVLNTLIGAINKTYSAIRLGGDKVSKIMPSLVQNLVSIQAQMEYMAQNQVETVPTRIENKMRAINDKVESINEAMTGKLKTLFKTNTIKLAHFDVLTKISELNGIRHLRDSRLFQDIIYNLVKRTNDEDVADFYQLYRQIKKVQESDKEKLKYNITVVLKESLKALNDSELKASKRTLLDTDVHTLLKSGMSIDEIAELMSDEKKLGSEIKTRETNIRRLANKKLAGAYLKQAENLGYYMVNRQDKIVNAMKNAHNIVNAYFDTNMAPLRKQITNKEQLIEQVDILATLHALKFSGVENKMLTVEAISKSKEGLVQAINTLGNAMTIYDKELFEKQRGITNVDYRVKGYSYQQSTEEKSMFMVTEDEMNWYRKLPWMKVVKDVSHLSLTNNKTKKYLIIANNIDVGRTKGAIDIIGFKRSGIDVKDIMYSDGLQEENVRDTIDKLKRGYNNKVYNDVDMKKEGSELSPILDMNGEIVNYKFDMSHEDKVAYMSLNDNIIDAVAGTLTNTHAKTSAIGENMKVVNWIVNDSDKHYRENPSAFTIIEPNMRDKKSKTAEMWKIIPEYTRNYIKMKTGEHKLIVRTDMLNDVLGYKDFSLSDIEWVKQNHPVLSRHILELESLWKNIVGKYKKIVVTLMGEVVFSNMFSNMMMAIQHGISPARFVKKIKEGWDTLDAYEKDSNLIVQLKVRKVAGEKELDAKIKALEEKLKRNPMHVFVQDGLFAPIVEDINAGMYTDKNAVDRMIDKTMKRVPDKLKGVFDLLYVNDNTSLYATMLKLVQYSDIISRYAVHEALINKGMSNQEAMNYLDQLFVNYNYNENRYLKYMNDVGLVMFTKYFFRTPKALIQMASKYPTFTYGTQLLQTVTGLNVVDAADSYYNPMVSFFARFQSPSDMISEVIDPNIQGIFSFPELVR